MSAEQKPPAQNPSMQELADRLSQIVGLGEPHEKVGDLTTDSLSWERRYHLSLTGANIALEKLVAPAEGKLNGEEIAHRMEQDGAVKEAPNFRQQAHDESRVNRFTYKTNKRGGGYGSMTEIEGLKELENFL